MSWRSRCLTSRMMHDVSVSIQRGSGSSRLHFTVLIQCAVLSWPFVVCQHVICTFQSHSCCLHFLSTREQVSALRRPIFFVFVYIIVSMSEVLCQKQCAGNLVLLNSVVVLLYVIHRPFVMCRVHICWSDNGYEYLQVVLCYQSHWAELV
jgi:hypothetical protein